MHYDLANIINQKGLKLLKFIYFIFEKELENENTMTILLQ